MPLLSVNTNVQVTDEQRKQFLKDATHFVAMLLNKQEQYIMIELNDGQIMSFSGTDDNCAMAYLNSLGLPTHEYKAYSHEICEFLETHLDIASNRTYILFNSPERHAWGWNKGTFG